MLPLPSWLLWTACTAEPPADAGSDALARLTPGWTIHGIGSFSGFGSHLAADGDANGDGALDVLVGAPFTDGAQSDEGAAYFYPGGRPTPGTAPTWQISSGQWLGRLGVVAFAGDLDADGYDDVLVGAPEYDDGQGNEGAVFVHRGGPAGPSAVADEVWTSDLDGAWLGTAVSRAGDVNGDGIDDVLVGAKSYTAGERYEGAAAVWLGSVGAIPSAPAWLVDADQAWSAFGAAAAGVGDVDGDGYDDVLVGAPDWDETVTDEGAAFLFPGGPGGPATTASWRIAGGVAGTRLGATVSGAGDVNADPSRA